MTKDLRRLIRLVKQVDRSLSKKWTLVSTEEQPSTFRVKGMIPNIKMNVHEMGILVTATSPDDTGELFDFLGEFECLPRHRKGKGWYCGLCHLKPPIFFPSKRELWLQHAILPFFTSAQASFKAGHALVYWQQDDGCGWAKIVGEEESLTVASSECFWTMKELFGP